MEKWVSCKASDKANTSVMAQLNTAHKENLPQNRKYSSVIIQSLIYATQ